MRSDHVKSGWSHRGSPRWSSRRASSE
ncbi:unnamed protein product [Spirodela intermedia]|uniref:Uncharacterized protein n=1 Tax=Spirodela intermedia TaxID=51605 RepID=A0A7I8KZG9_SPIIN|nr:unnamed protein product [Spirodela intermedia]